MADEVFGVEHACELGLACVAAVSPLGGATVLTDEEDRMSPTRLARVSPGLAIVEYFAESGRFFKSAVPRNRS
jgi:hypothetical protein